VTDAPTNTTGSGDLRSQRALLVIMVVVGLVLGGLGLWTGYAFFTGGSAPIIGDVDKSIVIGTITVLLTFPVTGAVLKGIALLWFAFHTDPPPTA
jgi:hypothetical protein